MSMEIHFSTPRRECHYTHYPSVRPCVVVGEVVGEEDVDARQEVGEVSEEKCGRPIGCSTPIEVGIARRRTGARMGGRGKKKGVGVGGRKWAREERRWLYECMC